MHLFLLLLLLLLLLLFFHPGDRSYRYKYYILSLGTCA